MIVYADKEEIAAFAGGTSDRSDGYAYEWEGEGVVHVRLAPLLHGHGLRKSCVFVKGEPPKDAAQLVIAVSGAGGDLNAAAWTPEDGYAAAHAVSFIPARSDLYSRNKGLLELGILESKRVMVIGLGSFGSQISIELAKAGVGQFALFDFDRVELHNLSRHTGTTADLGRLKTDVIYDAILGKNPYARVDKFPLNINDDLDLMAREIDKADVVICATDNNESRFNLSRLLVSHPKVCIFGRAVTRAEGGDVFVSRPGGPCYCGLIGNDWFDAQAEEVSSEQAGRRSGRIAAYMSAADADAVVQVGLSADIEPICNLMVKIALVELSRGSASGISQLESELVFDYYMWANRRERRYANWAPMPNAGARPTILRWYGARIAKDEHCAICGRRGPALDTGDDFEARLGGMDAASDVNVDLDIRAE